MSVEDPDSIDISASLSKNKLVRTLQYGIGTIFHPYSFCFGWLHIFASVKRVLLGQTRKYYADRLNKNGSPCQLVRHKCWVCLVVVCGYSMIEIDLPGAWTIQTCSKLFCDRFGAPEKYVQFMKNWDTGSDQFAADGTSSQEPRLIATAGEARRP